MGEPDTDRNCSYHYGAGIYCAFSGHEGSFAFRESHEGY